MLARFFKLLAVCSLYCFYQSALAADVIQYTQKTLSNGNSVMDYTTQDGKRLRQVSRPDGTIMTTEEDSAAGKRVITKQKPDGTVEVKTEQSAPSTASNEPVANENKNNNAFSSQTPMTY